MIFLKIFLMKYFVTRFHQEYLKTTLNNNNIYIYIWTSKRSLLTLNNIENWLFIFENYNSLIHDNLLYILLFLKTNNNNKKSHVLNINVTVVCRLNVLLPLFIIIFIKHLLCTLLHWNVGNFDYSIFYA